MITVLIAGIFGFLISLTALPVFIKKMKSLKLGQLIREEGPAAHQHKAGTPTMAGLIFIPAAILAYFLTLAVSALLFGTAPVPTATAWLTIAFTLGMLGVGAADDIMKFRISLSGTNAVNFTDGLDGLAGGIMMTIFSGYLTISIWQYVHACSAGAGTACYDVRDPGSLALIAASLVGSLAGFLWWNVSKAQIFMGDSGSLALGGAMVAFALFTRTELLLLVIALIPVLEVFSVIVQKFVFKTSRKRSVAAGEKPLHAHRYFRMTPFHHHMEKVGVNGKYSIDKRGIAPGTVSSGEVNSVFRLWVVNALCVLVALALFFGDWFSQTSGVIH